MEKVVIKDSAYEIKPAKIIRKRVLTDKEKLFEIRFNDGEFLDHDPGPGEKPGERPQEGFAGSSGQVGRDAERTNVARFPRVEVEVQVGRSDQREPRCRLPAHRVRDIA
jgi:hypothetical protein